MAADEGGVYAGLTPILLDNSYVSSPPVTVSNTTNAWDGDISYYQDAANYAFILEQEANWPKSISGVILMSSGNPALTAMSGSQVATLYVHQAGTTYTTGYTMTYNAPLVIDTFSQAPDVEFSWAVTGITQPPWGDTNITLHLY